MTTTDSPVSKDRRIAALARLRRQPNAGTRQDGYSLDYRRLEEFHDGFYDQHGWVSPWTVSACNVDTDLMIIGQDWASEDFLSKDFDPRMRELGHDPALATNRNLRRLLHEAFDRKVEDTFATNAFVFAKPGGMNTRLPPADLTLSATRFALKEIEIVQPRMVICLGIGTFNGLRAALNCRLVRLDAIDYLGPAVIHHGCELHGVPHVGARGLGATGGYGRSLTIWRALAVRLTRSSSHSLTSLRSESIKTDTMSDSSGS
jgi:restriction system protein